VNSNDKLEEWEVETIKYLDYLVDSDHEEDLVGVLRAHIYIELELYNLLAARYPGQDQWLQSKTKLYHQKVDLTGTSELLDVDYRNMFTEIGRLRNRFAHPPVKRNLDEDDLAALKASLPKNIEDAANNYSAKAIYKAHDLTTPSAKVRIILIVVFNWLCSRAAHERDNTKPVL
jgi:hypothetical protein